MICSKLYNICINVEMCDMCKPDTHALAPVVVGYPRNIPDKPEAREAKILKVIS